MIEARQWNADRELGDCDRRLVKVGITETLWRQLVTTGYRSRGPIECVSGVPEDAVLVTAYIDPEMADAWYVFYHPSFDQVQEGMRIPALGITTRIIDDGVAINGPDSRPSA